MMRTLDLESSRWPATGGRGVKRRYCRMGWGRTKIAMGAAPSWGPTPTDGGADNAASRRNCGADLRRASPAEHQAKQTFATRLRPRSTRRRLGEKSEETLVKPTRRLVAGPVLPWQVNARLDIVSRRVRRCPPSPRVAGSALARGREHRRPVVADPHHDGARGCRDTLDGLRGPALGASEPTALGGMDEVEARVAEPVADVYLGRVSLGQSPPPRRGQQGQHDSPAPVQGRDRGPGTCKAGASSPC